MLPYVTLTLAAYALVVSGAALWQRREIKRLNQLLTDQVAQHRQHEKAAYRRRSRPLVLSECAGRTEGSTAMNTTHRGWNIEISIGRFDASCWVTAPNGDEFKLYIPKDQHTNDTLAMARAFINRQIRIDQEKPPCQAS